MRARVERECIGEKATKCAILKTDDCGSLSNHLFHESENRGHVSCHAGLEALLSGCFGCFGGGSAGLRSLERRSGAEVARVGLVSKRVGRRLLDLDGGVPLQIFLAWCVNLLEPLEDKNNVDI